MWFYTDTNFGKEIPTRKGLLSEPAVLPLYQNIHSEMFVLKLATVHRTFFMEPANPDLTAT